MQITQVLDPFSFKASAPNGGTNWTAIIIIGIIGAIGFYFYKKYQRDLFDAYS